jgi:ribosome-associated protein
MGVKRAKKPSNTEDLLTCIVDAIQEKKGKNIVSLEIGTLPNAVCKYFVFCNADSTTQVDAIANNIEEKVLEKQGEKVYRSDGYQNAIWIVLDYIDIVVHVFQTEWRDYYRVEALWADAKAIRYENV